MDGDDEISSLLRQFRVRPTFGDDSAVSPGPMKQKKKRRNDREFSSVRYNASHGSIIFNYMHLHHTSSTHHVCICLEFEMSVSTKIVSCTYCSAPMGPMYDFIKHAVDTICTEKLTEYTGGDGSTTLFSVASRLLQHLNHDIPTILLSNIGHEEVKEETFNGLVKRLTQMTKPPIRQQHMCHLLDLQTLLLRCAAAGRTRSHTFSPIPLEFELLTSKRNDCDELARLILSVSDEMYMCGFRGEPIQQQTQETPEAWTLLSYLLTLPQQISSLSRVTNNTSNSGNSIGISSKDIVGKLTLDLSRALGDPAPSFSKLVKKYGTITAYHGTNIESTWSILNYGLQNLSNNKNLSQNGAILGDGVYLSSSRQVAESFAIRAAERPPRSLAYAFHHESLLHLLSYARVDVTNLDSLDTYVIKCLPVFEAIIIKPPVDDKDFDERISRQEGKYFVCEQSEFVRIKKLHLTFELSKNIDVWQCLRKVPWSLLVILIALAWSFL